MRTYLFFTILPPTLWFAMDYSVTGVHKLMKSAQKSQRHHKNHHSGSAVQESVRVFRLDVGENARQGDAARVGEHGDRNRCDEKRHPQPGLLFEEITVYEREK